jgi:hypothetical protein
MGGDMGQKKGQLLAEMPFLFLYQPIALESVVVLAILTKKRLWNSKI